MLFPRFSLRQLMALMGVSSLFFLVAAFAVRGEPWAVAVTLAFLSLTVILLVHSAFFFAAWIFALIASGLRRSPAPPPVLEGHVDPTGSG